MMTTTIPATRSGLSFPVTIGAPIGAEDHLAPMVRSFLSADDKMDWSYVVTYNDGSARRYTFDGAEVVRGSAYIPGINALRAAFVAYRDETHGMMNDVDENGQAVTDNLGYAPSERKAINRRDAARRKVASAMGFDGIKAWKAAGSPVDWDKVRGSVKTTKAFDTIVRESDLYPLPTPSETLPSRDPVSHPSFVSPIPRMGASIIRPHRRPGQYQGHSHNN